MNRLRVRTRDIDADQTLSTWLTEDDGALALIEEEPAGESTFPITAEAIRAVFERYGRPLEVELPAPAPDDAMVPIALPDGAIARLRAFEYRSPVDVIPNDYLVIEREGEEPRCGPARLLGAAMVALSKALARREAPPSN